jgi:CubicO group peptidase (beta-lactamase class C family)
MNDFMAVEAHLEQLCRQQGSVGVVIAIVREEKIVYARAFGQHDENPLTLNTPLSVASLTKPVFAYAVLKLNERGILDLDTPLVRFLPDAYLPDEPYLPLMTARHALSHTTGFPNWRDESGLRAASCPGSEFNYSTEGLLYLQTVIEHLTHQSLSDYMTQNVFAPFGMANSRLIPEDLSVVQSYLPEGLRGYGGISLYTTAPDYARFLIEMLHPSRADEFRLCSTSLGQMLKPQVKVGDQEQLSWGLGWGIQHAEPEDSFWHFGVKRGHAFNFALGYPAEQTGVVILTSQTIGLSICEEIAHSVFGDSRSLPAFRWLLPPKFWRADGRKPLV